MKDLFSLSGTADFILLTAFHSLWLSIGVFLIIRLRRFTAPAVRSAWCTFTLILLLVLPLITWVVPRTGVRAQPGSNMADAVSAPAPPADLPPINNLLGMKTLPSARVSQWRTLTNGVGLLWLAITLGCLGRLLYELAFLKGYCTGQQEVQDGRISSVLREINASFGFRKQPRFFVSPNLTSPVSMGVQAPLVLFPANLYPSIGDEELRAILLHELAHIYHYDHLLGLLQRIVRALYWWNPFVYSLCSALSLAREEVSDNYVISGMKSASIYARLLVSLIEKTSLISRMPCTAGMATPYESLETRVKNILSKERDMGVRADKRTISGIAAAMLLICGLIFVGSRVEVFGVYQVPSSFEAKPVAVNILKSGGQFDMDLLHGSLLILEASDQIAYQSSPIQVHGDQGNCEFATPVPPGSYKLFMSVLGLKADVFIPPTSGKAVTLMVNISPGGLSIQVPLIRRNEAAGNPQTTPIRLDASDPPVILSRVGLEYPPEFKALKISGSAKVLVTVNEKGEVYEASILSCHPHLQKPALDAIVHWKFQPLMVNGEPKPFIATVTIDFHF